MDAANQIFVFLVCVLTGVASGVVYEVFYILRKLFPSAFSIAFDVAFFLVFAGMSIFASVLFAFPNFRVYMYLGGTTLNLNRTSSKRNKEKEYELSLWGVQQYWTPILL